ncbi:MAG: FAD-dependent 5-carboxymethylaminomethyl-2-thiouridine(34) oxidoreductase MnmC [Rubrivivax sp.]|nr:FAD-dependent 5-carboxymethylaminomethyl-2-thiouridine(34) oxidoreductase MnmC [Rubrivivax sp.]
MKTRPITPARIDFGASADEPPRSPDFDDLYHPRVGAAAQARHVFLQGNGLPGRWAARRCFTILETGFGLGNNFLATWDAWRHDPARCERLFFVSVERHPPTRDDLARAHAASPWPALATALLRAWPPLVANLHPIDFDDGRVHLLLALGDVASLLPALHLSADAFFLDGFAPARNPAMWQPRLVKALGRKAAPGATAATWSVARELHAGLTAAGFEVQRAGGIGGKREISIARWAPRFLPRGPAPAAACASGTAVVVGAGLAGAAVAQALARLGLAVTVFDRHAEPAAETSGNPAGLFHGTVNADDGIYARLFRAAALVAQRVYRAAVDDGVAGRADGLLRLDTRAGGFAAMRATLERLGLPPAYVQALDAGAASALAGVTLPAAAWFYPGGGWIAPPAWVRHALATPGVRFRGGVAVAALERQGTAWLLRDAAGRVVAQAAAVVLANAADAARLLAPMAGPPWPLDHSRGQVTQWAPPAPMPLALPVAGDGYALPLPAGGLLCGATREAGTPADDAAPRLADHRVNLDRLQRLTGLPLPQDMACLQGRVGWRLHSDDRLPIAGALPSAAALRASGQRLDQARLLPREGGLFVLTALGARGLTLAPLLGRLVAAQATGTPWPLEQDLADAVDPARWVVRGARAAASGTAGADDAKKSQPG